jgi:hypothetical protein
MKKPRIDAASDLGGAADKQADSTPPVTALATAPAEQIGARTKKRGLARSTLALRDAIQAELRIGGTWTVRQIFYAVSVAGAIEKTEQGYRQVQRQAVAVVENEERKARAVAEKFAAGFRGATA